ncbi:MAG: hypothetical protein WKF57_05975 [Nakamurella sp.]
MTIGTCDLEVNIETCTDTDLVRVTHAALVRGKAGRRQVPGHAVGFTLPEPLTMRWLDWSGIVELVSNAEFRTAGELRVDDRAALVREYRSAMQTLRTDRISQASSSTEAGGAETSGGQVRRRAS